MDVEEKIKNCYKRILLFYILRVLLICTFPCLLEALDALIGNEQPDQMEAVLKIAMWVCCVVVAVWYFCKNIIPLIKDYKYVKNSASTCLTGIFVAYKRTGEFENPRKKDNMLIVRECGTDKEFALLFAKPQQLEHGQTYLFAYYPNSKLAVMVEKVERENVPAKAKESVVSTDTTACKQATQQLKSYYKQNFLFRTLILLIICVCPILMDVLSAKPWVQTQLITAICLHIIFGVGAVWYFIKDIIPFVKDYRWVKENTPSYLTGVFLDYKRNINIETQRQENTIPLVKEHGTNKEFELLFAKPQQLEHGQSYLFAYYPNSKLAVAIKNIEQD